MTALPSIRNGTGTATQPFGQLAASERRLSYLSKIGFESLAESLVASLIVNKPSSLLACLRNDLSSLRLGGSREASREPPYEWDLFLVHRKRKSGAHVLIGRALM